MMLIRARRLRLRARLLAASSFITISVSTPALALDPNRPAREFVVKAWDDEDGLPHRIILTLLQSRDGYLWIGTQSGLVRFDGIRFTVFDSSSIPAINENSIRALAQAPDDSFWIAPLRADLIKMKKGRFERQDGLLPENWKRGGVQDLLFDSQGVLWIIASRGVGRIGSDGKLDVLLAGEMPTDLNYIRRRIVEDNEGCHWFSSADGVRCVAGERVSAPISNESTRGLYATSDGALWLGVDGKGLYRFHSGRLTSIPLPISVPQTSFRINAITGDRDGNLWIGTNAGLFRYKPGRSVDSIALPVATDILDLLEDSQGSLWVATRDGLYQIKDPPFRNFAVGLGLQEVPSFTEDSSGAILFVSLEAPFLQKVDQGRVSAVEGRLPDAPMAVYRDHRGRILLGCGMGLYVSRNTGWLRIADAPLIGITAIAEDAEGRLWLADVEGAVYLISRERTIRYAKPEGLPGQHVEKIHVASDGCAWIATHGGAFFIRGGRVEELALGDDPAWKYVRHVSEDADGTLWIGSRAGLTRIKNGQVRSFGTADGLPDAVVHCVVDDWMGNLWVGCSRGIYRVAKADFDAVASGESQAVSAVLFKRGDGIVSSQSWGNTALRARDGSLWFSSRHGVVTIPAKRIAVESVPLPVFVESAAINGRQYYESRIPDVQPGEGRLEFRFTALDYEAPQKILFRYRLEGLDLVWRDAGSLREAAYANVRAGSYVFRVIARGANGLWSRGGASFAFTLKPHWYETWWWYALAGVGVLGLSGGIHNWRTASLRSREKALARRVAERTRDLEREVAERMQTEEAVRHLAGVLEERVLARTAELETAKISLERDVAIRKRAEEDLSAEKERLAVTLRSIGDGVIATDVQGRIVLMNKVAEQLTDWKQADAAGRPLMHVFRIVDRWTRQPLPDPVEAVVRGEIAIELPSQALLIARDGRESLVADSAAPIRDPDSRVTGAVLVFRDVTEKRRIEEHLANTGKLESIGILAAGIAHDFNNLLTGIFGYIDLARSQSSEYGSVHQRLTKALEVLDRARCLSGQLLTFTAGGAPVTAPTDLGVLLRDGARFALAGSNVMCDVDVPDGLWLCDLDAGQISQVIDNLLINARQAMPGGGRIEIHAINVAVDQDPILKSGRYVRVSVSDHGVGIPVDHRSRVFDPFFTTKSGGTGLGLATAHSIVKRHGGHIEFESAVNEGTTFRLYFPVALAESRPDVKRWAQHGKFNGRALVMDDEEVVRDVLRDSLEGLGLRVVVVNDGISAIEACSSALAKNDPFDFAILDLTIAGGMGGRETLSVLRQMQPTFKAIATSGYSIDPVMAEPEKHGFQGRIAKPFTIDDLAQTIDDLLTGDGQNHGD